MSDKTAVILVGHGSRRPGADEVLVKLAEKLRLISGRVVHHAYLQFSRPTIQETVGLVADSGFEAAVLLPVFIYDGQHVMKDIPAMIDELRSEYKLSFSVGEPVGPDHRLVEILNERLLPLIAHERPGERIAEMSFLSIEGGADLPDDPHEREIAVRVVHATGDRSLGRTLLFSPEAIAAGRAALAAGAPIVTDVNMVRAGISRALLPRGNNVISAIDEAPGVLPHGTTRAAAGMRNALERQKAALIAVGNAPTALNEISDMIEAGEIDPPLVIGVPVGFVGAVASKDRLASMPVEYVTLPGTRGGSPIAAAIVNALGRMEADNAGR